MMSSHPHYMCHYHRVRPENLIQSITSRKIVQEQLNAKIDSMPKIQRLHPITLIQAVTSSKIAQKRAKKAKQGSGGEDSNGFAKVKRTVKQLDYSKLEAKSAIKLKDIMAVLPSNYEKSFTYGELTEQVPVPTKRRYSFDDILKIGAQVEMAKAAKKQKA